MYFFLNILPIHDAKEPKSRKKQKQLEKVNKRLLETRAFPNKMAHVSRLMDKMTQIPLPQAWCRGYRAGSTYSM